MAKKKKNSDAKRETVEEFLARGGEIQSIPAVISEKKEINVRCTAAGPAVMLSSSSNPFIVDLDKDQFNKVLEQVNNLSPKEKEKLLEIAESRAENMSQLFYQSPGLEEGALLFTEKTKRKKKKKIIDQEEVDRLWDQLSEDSRKKIKIV